MSDVRLNIDILHDNFKEDHTNSRRFPGHPGVVDPAGGEQTKGQNVQLLPSHALPA